MTDLYFPADRASRAAQEEAALEQIRAPLAMPTPGYLESATDLLLAPKHINERLAHFPPEVYDLSAESALVRFMKVLLGEAGAGQLRKRLVTSRLQSTFHGSHFYDLDKFYGALFGVRRRTYEQLSINPYSDTATAEEWRDAHARDASYRSRIYAFARGINLGATPIGIEVVAEALLSVDCDIYETWTLVDQGLGNTGVIGDNRKEFVVRPKRPVTMEEVYDTLRVIERLKPADTIARIDPGGVEIHTPITLRGIHADSEYWEITSRVLTPQIGQSPYPSTGVEPVEQPRPAFSAYQGEAWSYNGDITSTVGYALDEDDEWQEFVPVEETLAQNDGSLVTYSVEKAIVPQATLMAGRAVSDGILVASPYDRGEPTLVGASGDGAGI